MQPSDRSRSPSSRTRRPTGRAETSRRRRRSRRPRVRLVPSCTAAVAVEIGPRWQLLAQCRHGRRRGRLAGTLPHGIPRPASGPVRAPGTRSRRFPRSSLRALLILLPEPEAGIPPTCARHVRSWSTGRAPARRALEAQQRDRAVRRVKARSRAAHRGAGPSRVTRSRGHDLVALAARVRPLPRPRHGPRCTRVDPSARADRVRPRPSRGRRRDGARRLLPADSPTASRSRSGSAGAPDPGAAGGRRASTVESVAAAQRSRGRPSCSIGSAR